MRLIDADALEEITDDRYSLGEIGRREHDDIVDSLKFAPTIKPEQHVVEQVNKPTFDTLVKLCLDDAPCMLDSIQTNQKYVIDSKLQKALDYFEDYIERSKRFLESNVVWDERTKNIVRKELKHYQVMVGFVKDRIN